MLRVFGKANALNHVNRWLFWTAIPIGIAILLAVLGLNTATGPRLSVDIEGINFAAVPGHPDAVGIVPVVMVRSSGSPTVVWGYTMTVVLSDGKSLNAAIRPFPTPGSVTLTGQGGNGVYREQDALYEKTINPLQAGSMTTGVLLFTVDGLFLDVFSEPGTKVILRFADVSGKHYSVSAKTSGISMRQPYFPGLPAPHVDPN